MAIDNVPHNDPPLFIEDSDALYDDDTPSILRSVMISMMQTPFNEECDELYDDDPPQCGV